MAYILNSKLPHDRLLIIYENDLSWKDRFNLAFTTRHSYRYLQTFKVLDPLNFTEDEMELYMRWYTDSQKRTGCFLWNTVVNIKLKPTIPSSFLKINHLYCIVKSLKALNQIKIYFQQCSTAKTHIIKMIDRCNPNVLILVLNENYLSWVEESVNAEDSRVVICYMQDVEVVKSNGKKDDIDYTNFEDIIDLEEGEYFNNDEISNIKYINATTNQSKRFIDMLQTPQRVKDSMNTMKDTMKLELFNNGVKKMKFTNNQSTLPLYPSIIEKFFDPNAPYDIQDIIYEPYNIDFILPNEIKKLSNRILVPLARKFMECVIICGNTWVLVTQFSIFISNHRSLDECAFPVKEPAKLTELSGEVVHKSYKGVPAWRELVIQSGTYQILATGGLYGSLNNGNFSCFLGSSVPFSFPSKIKSTCYTLRRPTGISQSYRLLVDYGKVGARLPAGFTSTRFELVNYQACHPLFYNDHISNTSIPNSSCVASLIISSYVSCVTTVEDVETCLEILLKTKHMQDILNGQTIISSARELVSYVNENDVDVGKYAKGLIYNMYLMEAATTNKSPVNMNTYKAQSEVVADCRLRDLMNNGFSTAINTINRKIMNNFKEKYTKDSL